MSNETKTYLGDGVYAEFSGYDVTLYTDDGIRRTNQIMLEPAVFQALVKWLERNGWSKHFGILEANPNAEILAALTMAANRLESAIPLNSEGDAEAMERANATMAAHLREVIAKFTT